MKKISSIIEGLMPHYKTIHYRIIGTIPNFYMQDVYHTISQAFSIWSAYTPVEFIRKTTITKDEVHITFYPDGPGAFIGNAIIDINTSQSFFIEGYKNYPKASWGPFDLIGVISHEIGHHVYGYFPKDPFEDNLISGSMMNMAIGEGQIRRRLTDVDIAFAQRKFGKLPTPSLIKMKLETAGQINYAPKVVFKRSSTLITVSGEGGTTSVFDVGSSDVKNLKINAINIKLKTYSSYAIINSVQIWDGIILQEIQVLSFNSYKDTPENFVLKIGLSSKPIFIYGLWIRVELLFLEKFDFESSANPNRVRKVEISAIDIEVIPREITSVMIK